LSAEQLVVFGLVISVIDAAIFVPQTIQAWKNRNNPNALSGISTLTIWLAIIAYCAWLIWDSQAGLWEAHAYAWIGLPAAILTIIIIYRSKRLKQSAKKKHCASCRC